MPVTKSGLFIPPSGPARVKKTRTLSLHAPDGRLYEVCPQCSHRASLRNRGAHEWWQCKSCGYVDCDTCPQGRHDLLKSA
jgi:ribosomal protein L37AE/L43A